MNKVTASTAPGADHRDRTDTWLLALIGTVPLVLLPPGIGLAMLWKLSPQTQGVLGLCAAAYLVAIGILTLGERRGRQPTFRQVLLIWAVTFVPVTLAVPPLNEWFSRSGILIAPTRSAMLLAPLLALVLLWLAFSIRGSYRSRLSVVVGLALIAVAAQAGIAGGIISRPEPGPSIHRSRVDSSLYELEITSYRHVIPKPFTQQGGITRLGQRYLLATGDGDLYAFSRPEGDGPLTLQRLPLKVPLNSADFATAMKGLPVTLNWFRVADVLAQQTPIGNRLLATHHYWNKDAKCYVMRVSMLEGTEAQLLAGSLNWRTLFETSPCLAVVVPGREPHFVGLENGGRLALLNDHELLVSIGDHAINGVDAPETLAQDPEADYGKIVHIDLGSGAKRVLSLGHRNPQGLTVDSVGRIWSTEHGPRGGDELNLVHEGANFGWPNVTYGAEYGMHVWPRTPIPGSHDGDAYTQPFYTWTPAIGVSQPLEAVSPRFEYWRGDLLVGALTDRSIWRVRVRDNRVVAAEPIPIGERVRDIVAGHRGELVLWTDALSVMFVEPVQQSPMSTAQQLYLGCATCHTVQRGQSAALGPDLEGVVGRPVAAVPGFEYSPAMRAAGGVWTRERLDAFLRNPTVTVPGTTMLQGGIADAQSRQALIEFMASRPVDRGTAAEDESN